MRLRPVVALLALVTPALAPLAVTAPSASAPVAAAASSGQRAAAQELRPAPAVDDLLPRTVGGREALRVVGDDLRAVAALNGRSPAELEALLLRDDTLVLTPSGRLAYRDDLTARSAPDAAAARATYPLSQTFSLHSRPGSNRTIFLDFDGATSFGSYWSTGTGQVDGFSLDDDPGFNAEEHAVVQEVWQRVAEDYAPFDVDVTTQDPGPAAITRSGTDDQVYGTRAQITGDVRAHQDLCGNQYCTGVAYIGVFDEPREHAKLQPAWVFTAYYDDASAIAETVSHEVGHNLGLDHDDKAGDDFDGYYSGHANWSPIMGSGPGPVVQWSNGAFAGSLNTEDDLAMIVDTDPFTYEGGLRLVPDEAGGTVASAAAGVPADGALITSRTDVDVFALGACSGSVTVTASPAPVSPNLDIELQLRDASGAVLGSDDPRSTTGDGTTAGGMGASVTVQATGPLYARVDGVGTGGPTTAYDDYGSLGRYTLAVSGCTGGPEEPTDPEEPPVPEVPEATVPGSPTIKAARPGARGGKRTAKVVWRAPSSDGGSALTGYVVLAHKIRSGGSVARTLTSEDLSPGRTRAVFRMPRGRWAFQVLALNALGAGEPSEFSRTIRPR